MPKDDKKKENKEKLILNSEKTIDSKKNETKEKKDEVEKNGFQKNKILIITIVTAVMVLLAIGIFFIVDYFNYKEPIKQVWGQTYYLYLKDLDENRQKKILGTDIDEPSEYKLNFYEIKGLDEPVMIGNYKYKDENYVDIFYIEDEKVQSIRYLGPSQVELLYNISDKEYGYYIKTENKVYTDYQEVSSKIKEMDTSNNKEESKYYSIKNDEKRTVTDIKGTEVSISKFDETFIKPNVKDNSINYEIGSNDRKLKESISTKAIEIKKTEELVKGKIANYVKEKLDAIVKKQKEMDEIVLEVQRIKEEEEAKRKAEEAKKRLTVGKYTLAYGTYHWNMDGQIVGTLILKKDGTCVLNQKSCTYSIGKHDFAQDISSAGHPDICLVLKFGSYSYYLVPYANNVLGDGDLEEYRLAN